VRSCPPLELAPSLDQLSRASHVRCVFSCACVRARALESGDRGWRSVTRTASGARWASIERQLTVCASAGDHAAHRAGAPCAGSGRMAECGASRPLHARANGRRGRRRLLRCGWRACSAPAGGRCRVANARGPLAAPLLQRQSLRQPVVAAARLRPLGRPGGSEAAPSGLGFLRNGCLVALGPGEAAWARLRPRRGRPRV
jgi:hypothetical protein